MPPIPEALSINQIAALTGTSNDSVREQVLAGELKHLPRIGRTSPYRVPLREVAKFTGIPRADLVAWLRENQTTEPTWNQEGQAQRWAM